MNLQDCLPVELRSPAAKITRVGAGMSGAGVHRVEVEGRAFVLKVSVGGEPLEVWRGRRAILERAAEAGLAPRLVHSDEARRAVLSELVVDRSFPALLLKPDTRDEAIALLGRTLRRVHGLPPPAGATQGEARDMLAGLWAGLDGAFALPAFAREQVRGVLGEVPPPLDRARVLSHNDVNPTNLLYDGERLVLLDWDTAGINDPAHDLASIAMFLRLDEATCRALFSAYEGQPVSDLPARFTYGRRVVSALCGAMFLHLARQGGHPGASGGEALDTTPSLGDFYQALRSGSLSLATPEGRWWGGLALIKESTTL
jgi:aminoglycoside phosphotransferase